MSPEVQKIIYEAAIKAGDELKGKLPPHRFHPKGRNSYAHVFERIKRKDNKSHRILCKQSLLITFFIFL